MWLQNTCLVATYSIYSRQMKVKRPSLPLSEANESKLNCISRGLGCKSWRVLLREIAEGKLRVIRPLNTVGRARVGDSYWIPSMPKWKMTDDIPGLNKENTIVYESDQQ